MNEDTLRKTDYEIFANYESEIKKICEERNIATSVEELPAIPHDYLRVVHVANIPHLVPQLIEKGLKYILTLSSTARIFSEIKNEEDYFMKDERFIGGKVIIMDVPRDEVNLHVRGQAEISVVPAKYIVGVLEARPHKDYVESNLSRMEHLTLQLQEIQKFWKNEQLELIAQTDIDEMIAYLNNMRTEVIDKGEGNEEDKTRLKDETLNIIDFLEKLKIDSIEARKVAEVKAFNNDEIW